jgi:hypothetical protein
VKPWISAVLILLFSHGLAHAGPVQKEMEELGIKAGDLGNWNELKDFLGLPFIYLEPEKKGAYRATISVTPLGKAEKETPTKIVEATDSEYAVGRKLFLQERDGKLLEMHKPRHFDRDSKTRVNAFGFEYSLDDEEFHEQTHYVFCKTGDMFIVKGLSSRIPASVSEMKKRLEQFRCGGSK